MSSIEKYLGKNEKILFMLKPARRAFTGDYIAIMILILGAAGSRISVILTSLMYMFITLSVILFIKVESGVRSKKYYITNERIILHEGIFSKKFHSCTYNQVTGIEFTQSFFEKSKNTGTILINTTEGKSKRLFLEKVPNPSEVKKKISEIYSLAARGLNHPTMHAEHTNLSVHPSQMQQPMIQPSHIHIHIHTDAPASPDKLNQQTMTHQQQYINTNQQHHTQPNQIHRR
ncbi:MAG: PH domain-containing protein [Candidatus Woesearchaeota archaeon]